MLKTNSILPLYNIYKSVEVPLARDARCWTQEHLKSHPTLNELEKWTSVEWIFDFLKLLKIFTCCTF